MPKPPSSGLLIMAGLLATIGAVMVGGGAYLLSLGGSPYYAVAGLMIVGSAVFVWRGRRLGAWIYGAMLAITLVWAIWESGVYGWALAPRLIGPLIVGLGFLLPSVSRRLVPAASRTGRLAVIAGAVIGLVLIVLIATHRVETSPRGNGGQVASRFPADPIDSSVAEGDWPAYGRTSAGTRFSPLGDITPENVNQLEPAWSYRLGSAPAGVATTLETTPIKIGDSLYACNGVNRIVSLDPVTGKERWSFDPHADAKGVLVATCRGVSYYRDPDARDGARCASRILTATIDARLIALDARTGELCEDFGEGGEVDLRSGMGPFIKGYYLNTSAPTIVRGNVVLGGWVTDNQMVDEPSGVVRAFDAITGKFKWAWDLGRQGVTTHPEAGKRFTPGTPNVWAPTSADEALGLVFLPTGNATPDFWGGHRSPEMDRYASSVVAVDAATGQVRWSFQTTHHDVWDYDVASQPTLANWPNADGKMRPAVIVPTKRGQLFILDRRTGEPIVPVEERPVPRGPAAGDWLAPTQPYSIMPSFAGEPLTERDMWGLTPLDQLWCRIKFREARYEGEFTPPRTSPSIQYPGYSGGFSWGGVAVDSSRGLMFVNVNRFAQYARLIPRETADRMGMKPYRGDRSPRSGEEALGKPQIGTPFAGDIKPFMSPLAVPCQQPPFGVVAAIDIHTRKVVWSRPFGTARDSGPMGFASGLSIPMGAPNLGGAVVTQSGLAFIGATQEKALRAFDIATGRTLWQARLPYGGNATPMTYRGADGRQYVVIAAGGNVLLGPIGDYLIAYALPKRTAADPGK